MKYGTSAKELPERRECPAASARLRHHSPRQPTSRSERPTRLAESWPTLTVGAERASMVTTKYLLEEAGGLLGARRKVATDCDVRETIQSHSDPRPVFQGHSKGWRW